jgi:hypothetical protein
VPLRGQPPMTMIGSWLPPSVCRHRHEARRAVRLWILRLTRWMNVGGTAVGVELAAGADPEVDAGLAAGVEPEAGADSELGAEPAVGVEPETGAEPAPDTDVEPVTGASVAARDSVPTD